jgi:leader peptidase (prepilin peptidase)/N-methyltransferase
VVAVIRGFEIVLAGLVGACVGSFLNVVLGRVPRGESIVHPPSHCDSCGAHLAPLELVPVVSWLALRGRCRHCGSRIPARGTLVEAGMALLFVVVAWALTA